MARIVAIVGHTASGKSTLAIQLNEILQWQYISIDGQRKQGGDWPDLLNHLRQATRPTLVESVILNHPYCNMLRRQSARMIQAVCDETIRQERKAARTYQHVDTYCARYQWQQKLQVNTTNPLSPNTVQAIADWCRGHQKD